MATTLRNRIRATIDAISHDSCVTEDTQKVAAALTLLYGGSMSELQDAISDLLNDDSWGSDGQPYAWLAEVSGHLDA